MKIDVRLSEASERQFRAALREYAKLLGTGIEEVIDETAAETAKRIAARTQPYGISKSKNEAFGKVVAMQAHRAIFHANTQGATSNPAAEHKSRRDNKGRVPKKYDTPGVKWKGPGIPPQERNAHVDKMVARAGMEKASWLDAGRKAWSKLKIPNYWIPKLKLGFATKTGQGMQRKVEIGNRLTYDTITEYAFEAAIKNGRRTMLGKMKRVLKKAEQAANRT